MPRRMLSSFQSSAWCSKKRLSPAARLTVIVGTISPSSSQVDWENPKLVAKTNGHSRAGKGMVGNLFVEGKETMPRAELEKRLVQMCTEEDLEYGMLIEDMGEGGGGGFRRRFFFGGGGGGGDLSLPAPSIAWRVYRDGHKELVRGATFRPVFGSSPAIAENTARRPAARP